MVDCLARNSWKRLKFRCTYWKTIIILVLLTVSWNEYISFLWARLFWSRLPQNGNAVKILFVADPQLQGYHDIYLPSKTLTDIAIWDADSYLSHGYTQAYNYLRPDIVVYLGDLLDEGSGAEESEFKTCVKRFYNIFYTDLHVKNVYIWGDNDVGGEGFDAKTDAKMHRFIEAFQQNPENVKDPTTSWSFQNVKDIDFIKIDQNWGQSFESKKEKELKHIMDISNGKYTILLNHMNVFFNLSPVIMQKIVKITKPNVVVSAHTHYARIIKCTNCYTFDPKSSRGPQKSPSPILNDGNVHLIKLKDTSSITEIMIPTCSYRMGVAVMGYGAAVIDEKGDMHYTTLWLPSRHKHFVIYVLLLVVILILSLAKFLAYIMSRGTYKGNRFV